MPRHKLHFDSGKRKGLRLKRGEVLTLCNRRMSAEDCGDPFGGDEICRRCALDARYPALAAERFKEGGLLHPACVLWWRREEPQEMCRECRDSLPVARTERGRFLWCALFRGLPSEVLDRAANLVQRKMRKRALECDERCYLCGVPVKRFRLFRPEIDHVHVHKWRVDPFNWQIAHGICNNLKGSTSGPENYRMLVSHRIALAEQAAALLLGRVGRCASAAVLYGGSRGFNSAWTRVMVREQRGVIGHGKLIAGDAPETERYRGEEESG